MRRENRRLHQQTRPWCAVGHRYRLDSYMCIISSLSVSALDVGRPHLPLCTAIFCIVGIFVVDENGCNLRCKPKKRNAKTVNMLLDCWFGKPHHETQPAKLCLTVVFCPPFLLGLVNSLVPRVGFPRALIHAMPVWSTRLCSRC